jgi:hypothetical protein
MMRNSTLALALLLGAIPGAAAPAPENGAVRTFSPAQRALSFRRELLGRLVDASGRQDVASPETLLTLSGLRDGETVTARLGVTRGDEMSFDLKLSGPVGTGPDTRLLDLDGLRGSATVEVGLLWTRWEPSPPDPRVQQAICDDFLQHERNEGRTIESFDCARSNLPEEGGWKSRFDNALDFGTPLLFGARGTLGHRTFDYRDPALDEVSVARTGYGLTATAGILPSAGYLGVAYRFQVSHSAPGAVQLCEPIAGPTLACADAVLGAPVRRERHLAQVEYRVFPAANLGINPRITFDLADGTSLVEMPMYFLAGGDGGLTGGVVPAWRSKVPGRTTGELGISLFVGARFGLLPQ